MKKKAIGVFDSGVGGLTVVKHIQQLFPYEDIVYFGDTARVPYGNKSPETIIKFSLHDAAFLYEKDIKCIVLACNTASAYAIGQIKAKYPDIPIIGMIESGSAYAVNRSKNGHIGVIGTTATIKSDVYHKAILKLNHKSQVYSHACPLFVPLVEEGFTEGEIAESIVHFYMDFFTYTDIDTLILGCTHYPIIKNLIQNHINKEIELIDSGEAAAFYLRDLFETHKLFSQSQSKGKLFCYLSSFTDKFNDIAIQCLHKPYHNCEIIDIDQYS